MEMYFEPQRKPDSTDKPIKAKPESTEKTASDEITGATVSQPEKSPDKVTRKDLEISEKSMNQALKFGSDLFSRGHSF